MDRRPVRLGPSRPDRGQRRRRREQPRLQRLVAKVVRKRPRQARLTGSANAVSCCRRADAEADGDLSFGQAAGIEPKHVTDLTHRKSLSGHAQFLSKRN